MEQNTETYSVYFDPATRSVVMEWNGYANSAQFREGTELMLNTLIKHKATKVLADIKNMVLIGSEDQEWLNANFLPRASKFGFKNIAIVKPDNHFNKVAVENISAKAAGKSITVSFFEDSEEARNWLGTLQ